MNKRRILLILPPNVNIIEPFCSREHKQVEQIAGFPLGLGYLASYLREKSDSYDLKILDGSKNIYTIEQIYDLIRDYDPDYVGITVYTATSKVAIAIAKMIKEKFDNKIVIAGGPHASDDYENLLTKYPYFDFVVIGEGEITMLKLLQALGAGSSRIKEVLGIAYLDHSGKQVVFTGERPLEKNINTFPPPARDLVDFDSYIIKDQLLPYAIEIMGSRGCSHRCVFCSFQKKWRTRSSENIIQEIKNLIKRYPRIKAFLFFDDNFSVSEKRVIDLCQKLIKEGLNKYSWSALCRVDQVTEEMLNWMKKAGCTKIMYGVETASLEVLKNLRKKIAPKIIKEAVELTSKIGIDVVCFFIVGNPGETPETLNISCNFAKKLKCHSTVWSIMAVYPGTELAKLQPCDDFAKYLYEPELEKPSEAISANVPAFENPELDRETMKIIRKNIERKLLLYKVFTHPLFAVKRIFQRPKSIMNYFLATFSKRRF